jgi:hypothetical protein
MDVAALVTWLITAVGGFVLLGFWITRGALRPAGGGSGGTRFSPAMVFSHFVLAAVGLVVWIVFVASDESAGLAWTAFVILVPVALLGFALLLRWLRGRGSASGDAMAPSLGAQAPAEQSFPVPVVVVHGLLAVTTAVLVLVAAIQAA